MSEKIIFYHNPMSRGRMVHWMLEECGAPYEVKLIDFSKGEHKLPAFTAVNPMGKLPTIQHKGAVVTEVGAIIAYLANEFPKAGLAPAIHDPKRGAYLRWMFFAQGCVDAAIVDKLFSRPPPKETAPLGYGSFADTFRTITAAITPGPYLLGETFSAADLFIGAQLGWGMMTKAVEPTPAIAAYVERCTKRPAMARVLAQGEAFSKKLQAA